MMSTHDGEALVHEDEHHRHANYRVKNDLCEQSELSQAQKESDLNPDSPAALQAQNPVELDKVRIGLASEEAARMPAIWNTGVYGIGEMGPLRSAKAFMTNQ
jgi:hypothetical protein